MQNLKDIETILKKAGCKLKPCTPLEVIKIEEFYQVKLPRLYKDFLSMMGKGAGHYMAGSSMFYDEIFSLKQYAQELVRENGLAPLPENIFVFWLHQVSLVPYKER